MRHLAESELNAWLSDEDSRSPTDSGSLMLIVRRPEVERREVVTEAELDTIVGLVGDNWATRGSTTTPDGASNPDAQLTMMNIRVARLVADDEERVALAGDQLYVDLDIGEDNLPAGSRIAIGDAVIEISRQPHTGCSKFKARFGGDALRWVSVPDGRRMRLRGVNARVVRSGSIRVGDEVRKL
jgi:hypothetical protein